MALNMKTASSTLTSKGQTTIPKEVREYLHLKPGDRMEFVIEPDGRVVLLPATLDVIELKGILPTSARPVTLEEMDEAIAQGASGQ